MAANPFYIQPSQANINPALQGVGPLVEESRAKKKQQADEQALMTAYKNGDADSVAAMTAKNPELGVRLGAMLKFKSAETEKNYAESVRKLASTSDPEARGRILVDRIDHINSEGGDPTQTVMALEQLQKGDTEGFEKGLELEFARTQGKQEWEAYKTQRGGGKEAVRREANQIKRESLELRRLEASLRREDNGLKREKLQLDIDSKREKITIAKKGLNKKAKDTMRQQGSLSKSIDDFISNKKYVNAMTGWRGRTPAVTDAGLEAEAFFDNIKNNLTLENLDKMTGVLSETDIKILSTSATAMQPGMGKKAMIEEMKKIQDVLKTKSKDIQNQLMDQPNKDTEASVDTAQGNQDTEAALWLKENPNDPQAAQVRRILQAQGAP